MITIIVASLLLIAVTPPLGAYMYRVYTSEKIGRLEGLVYKATGINPNTDQSWRRYASSVLWFSVVSMLFIYLIMRTQNHLPFNPEGFGSVNPWVSINTAASFMTNTNWQAYGGESTMSYLTQMLALTFQNFLSAAVGMSVAIALIRGFTSREKEGLGNFWRDTVRGVIYILFPLAIIVGIVLMSQGITQTLGHSLVVHGIQGFKQIIARGPVASQIAIKQLGTNGGGFYNMNSAAPFESSTPISNFIELFAILAIPAAITYTFGKMVGNVKQGWVLFAAMWILMVVGVVMTTPGELHATPAMQAAGISANQPNMEGKEMRVGPYESSLWAVWTTDASNGSVNSMHDSYQALGMLAPMFNIAVGEVIFGGVGSGLYGMLFFVIVAVFIGGLMVGRTPEYLGKKVKARQVKIVVVGIVLPFLVCLGLTAVAILIPQGLAGRENLGPHGFSEIFYAYISQMGNNGSALAGLTVNTPFYTVTGAFDMLVCRFVPILAALALGGSIAVEKIVPFTAGTLRTDTRLFTGLLVGVVVIIGALTFLPGLALGPIVEHLMHGRLF
ncbi:MAG TPA: potassium-transporting ATPase subunit KdpA [Actinomycetota bacterium]|nr:potassium-transporting ATPase subunit KdpA [Actinomycetota bacterium]